jgi:mandelate racemase
MNVPDLVIAGVTAKAVVAPLVRPVKTAVGTISAAPLVLIDVTTREGITGRAYILAPRLRCPPCIGLSVI